MNRRQFLRRAAFTTAASSMLPGTALLRAAHSWTQDATRATEPVGLDRLQRALRDTPHDRVLSWVTEQLQAGVPASDLWHATFLAGIHDVEPDPVGFDLHCVLAVSPARELAAATDAASRLLPLYWNVDDFKHSQAGDARGNDWHLPPVPDIEPGDAATAARRLTQAMDDWDADGADRAIATLHAHAEPDAVFELLWPYGARSFADIGHNAIFTAHCYRTIQTLGWSHAQPVLRSLVKGLLSDARDPSVDVFPRHRRALERLPETAKPPNSADPPDVSLSILRALRTASIDDAASTIMNFLGRGATEQSIWDGLRLFACELLMQQPGLLAVHPLTSVNALRFASRTTRRAHTRRLMMVQAAAWMSLFRQFLSPRGSDTRLQIDDLQRPSAAEIVRVDEIVHEAAHDKRKAAALVLRLADQAPAVASFQEAVRQQVFRKGYDSHNYKFAAALSEEYADTQASWAPYVLASSVSYLPSPHDNDTPIYPQVQEQLRILSS